LSAPQFFSVAETLLARLLGGRDALEKRLDEVISEEKAKEAAARRGRKAKGPARVLSLDTARRMQADAESYDKQMSKGG
jgi:hypothetical protein